MTQTTPSIGHIIVERDIHAYVDGELSSERRAVVEAHLAAHPDKLRRVEAYRLQNARLRLLSTRVASGRGGNPGLLFSGTKPRRATLGRKPMRYINSFAVALAIASVAALAWMHFPGAPLLTNAMPQTAYSTTAGESDNDQSWSGLFTVRDMQRNALERASRGTALAPPDAVPASFQIPGFRRISQPDSVRENALPYNVVYEDDTGASLGLLVARHTGPEHQPDAGTHEAFTILLNDDGSLMYWEAGPLAYMLTGAFDRRRFISIATAVMAQTRNDRIEPASGALHADNGNRPNVSATSSVTNAVVETGPGSKIQDGVEKHMTGGEATLPIR